MAAAFESAVRQQITGIRTVKTLSFTEEIETLLNEAPTLDRYHLELVWFGYELRWVNANSDNDSAHGTDDEE